MSIDALAALVRERQPCVVLTGAGISTESGIPDFRSPTGIWAEVDPFEVASLHAFRAAGRQPPVNIVLVCEGEEEIGSPNFRQIVFHPPVEAALRKAAGIIIPLGSQSPDGTVEVALGAKGICELELVATGERWGRGPAKDIHSSLAAKVDSPTPYSRCSNGSAFLKRSSVPGATTSVTGVVRPPDMRTL